MEQDAAVLEDKAGKCPLCGMRLVPVRLDSKWWCPTHQTTEVHDGPGKCPRDGKDLVQVTLSQFWTCASDPAERLLEPGACADGKPRKIGYEVRAHGDHNPRHGGQFFMAENQWHHVEGTYPAHGTFRLFFYDNFTKPLDPKGFTGRLTTETNGRPRPSWRCARST
jgi:ssDNA-binding Zn-finger/Zn-ribbon topoisomerase 1